MLSSVGGNPSLLDRDVIYLSILLFLSLASPCGTEGLSGLFAFINSFLPPIMKTVLRRRCQLLSSLACCIVHSTSGFSRIVEPMMPLPLHLSVNNDNINRSTTTPPPPFSSATSPLSPNSFAGQVESALLSRFRQSTIERVLTSWRYLGEFIHHFEIVCTMHLR